MLSIVDELIPQPRYTELSKKEQGRIRYAKQQERYRQKNKKKTRPESSGPKRITDGMSGKSKPQTQFVSRFPASTRKGSRAMSFEQFQAILDQMNPNTKW